ncbi:hypothetical protein C9374_008975 [Naegleria lovaniensis]|uniref:Cystatin domain-containing protein n=1 Tax=Naegleria lovaniensis TaxID=51637 RepID=A0AA88KFK9_NAELO|nr:uncharacterized protein C9374_008975 [Naegleria lovaniensis]KAG2377890.1 hypothetical protein C9374_008975 [Naegleria lovaniensis]
MKQLIIVSLFLVVGLLLYQSSSEARVVPGGKSLERNKQTIKALGEFLNSKLSTTNDYSSYSVEKVIKVERQVVAGVNYFVRAKIRASRSSQHSKIIEARIFEPLPYMIKQGDEPYKLVSVSERRQ